jgi:ABC-type Zn2+ transport system substrate-binding protein/surface adhesin
VKIITFILALLFLATPMQAHLDIVAFDAIESHIDEDNYSEDHQQKHHDHDSEDEKQSDHHHHCVDLSVSVAYIPSGFNFNFIVTPSGNEIIDFYTRKHSSKDLESLFQPPRVA